MKISVLSVLVGAGIGAIGVIGCPQGHASPGHRHAYVHGHAQFHKRHILEPRQDTSETATTSTQVSETSTPLTSSRSSLSSTTTTVTSAVSSSGRTASSSSSSTTLTVPTSVAVTIQSTILVIARSSNEAASASSGFNAYGIPFQILLVPQGGTSLPALNSTSGGNFGGIVVASGIAYYYGSTEGWHSALTTDQWNQLYVYQTTYGVRMVQYDVYPQEAFGTTVVGSCCDSGVEQSVFFTNTTAFAQAGIRQGAGMSTQGLFHYIATVTDRSTTTEIAQFAANSQYSSNSTAAVINNFNGRQQMVFFTSWATDWSATSNFLQHAYIAWVTRGLYAGYRRVNLNTQIDDMFLKTQSYHPSDAITQYYPGNYTYSYRTTPDDMSAIASWVPKIQAKMNKGSYYRPEVGHNGNGNIQQVDPDGSNDTLCPGGPILLQDRSETTLEYQKPLGTGTDAWPTSPASYSYTLSCLNHDPLKVWWATKANRNWFMHLSHTFTHQAENNATYNDIYKEITFNQAWLKQVGLEAGNFSANSLIPPAITGLHNGDAIRAWVASGLTNCVGDNSRPVLRNTQNPMWPYITTMAANGYDGFVVIPRWSNRIYYNCDVPACTTQEWIDTSAGVGDFSNLMAMEKSDTMRHLFGLYHDGYMFHQENLRATGVSAIATADGTKVYSLFQAWVEQTVQEFTRLVTWPMQSLKQSDLAISFANRMARDACNYQMSWNSTSGKVTGVTITASSNTCSVPIPLTVPGSVTNTQGFATEKIGSDPLTIWVKLSGEPVTFTLSTAVAL